MANNLNLTALNLHQTKLGDAEAIVLARIKNIKKMVLSANNISNQGAIALASNKSLEELNLYLNNVGDKGVQALAANTSLTELNLFKNNISEQGIKALAARILRKLSLDNGTQEIYDALKTKQHNVTIDETPKPNSTGLTPLQLSISGSMLGFDQHDVSNSKISSFSIFSSPDSKEYVINHTPAAESILKEMVGFNK